MKNIFIPFLFSFVIASGSCSGTRNAPDITITEADLVKAGSSIMASEIGEPIGSIRLNMPRWVEASGETPAYGVVEGSIFSVDPDGWPINFRVLLPATWSRRAMQQGGAGMNGTITVREGRNPMLARGFAIYGSDSGHQMSGMGGFGGAQKPLAEGPVPGDAWALNDEAIRNLGYMQMKKTHDAVMVILQRIYGAKPVYNYYIGGSQGGREALTVAQRYPDDYDGIIADVPIVNFSTLMLAPELLRIREKPLANWVTPSKINAIRAEFLRQCDGLDGLSDGIINNYIEARAIFNVNDGTGTNDPWAALRAPGGADPDPDDSSVSAKLTDGQIETLEFTYSSYIFPEPLANGVKSFGMWLPTITPDDFGTITGTRSKGQEGADENARLHASLGTLGVTGFMMQDVKANPLDYDEQSFYNRRSEISEWLDSTDPDLTAFYRHGGKIIMTIGTMDMIASSGAQLDYYQSLIDEMGEKTLGKFARMYVVPQAGHGLSGRSYNVNGDGDTVETKNIPAPNQQDKLNLIIAWVENKQAPAKTLVVSSEGRLGLEAGVPGYLLCSYPEYPRYSGGPADQASSWTSTAPSGSATGLK